MVKAKPFKPIALLSLFLLTASMIAADETNQSRQFREKYRLDERGKRQLDDYSIPEINQSIDMKLSNLQRIKEINFTAFERDELNLSKLKQEINKSAQDKNAEAINLFFRSVEAQRRIDEQTRFILKDEAFGAYEYAGEYSDIIDDQLKDANNPVFSGSRLKENNNRYLNPNEQVIVIISSSIPKSTIKSYFEDIDAIEAPFDVKFVLRGVVGAPETLLPTMEYIASIVSKESNRNALNENYDNKPFNLKEAVSKAVKRGTDAKARTDSNETAANETIDTYKVKIDINPKVTRKYSIDRVPAVIYVKNYNPAIEEPKSLSEAIKANDNPNSTENADANSNPNLKANANLNANANPNANDQEEFYVAYGASKLDYSLSKINEQAKSEGLKRLIDALQSRGFFRDKQSNKERE